MAEGGIDIFSDIRSDAESVDREWLQAVLDHAGVSRGATLTDIHFDGYVGTGQVGSNGRFSLTWSDPAGRPATVMGKFPSRDAEARAHAFGGTTYVSEWNFYDTIAPLVRVRAPHCHYVAMNAERQQFCLIMEDLHGSEQADQFVGISVDEAALAVEQAVLLHAPLWGRENLGAMFPGSIQLEERVAAFMLMYEMFLPTFIERIGPLVSDEISSLARDIAPLVGRWAAGSGSPTTVAHNDFRPDNFLYGRAAGAPPLVIVDWQTVGEGNGMSDLGYMIAGSFTAEKRRVEEDALVRSYHSQLVAAGVGEYSWDDCWRDYRFYAPWGLIMAVFATSMAARTERGDQLFALMATQYGTLALDHGSLDLLRA